MSDMIKRYEESTKLRPQQAKQAGSAAVNFFDVNSEFAEGFTPKVVRGDPTKFTTKALEHYNTEVQTISTPESFIRLEQDVPLNRWTPNKKYYAPGQYPG